MVQFHQFHREFLPLLISFRLGPTGITIFFFYLVFSTPLSPLEGPFWGSEIGSSPKLKRVSKNGRHGTNIRGFIANYFIFSLFHAILRLIYGVKLCFKKQSFSAATFKTLSPMSPNRVVLCRLRSNLHHCQYHRAQKGNFEKNKNYLNIKIKKLISTL